MHRLAKIRNGVTVYDAGLPRFPRNFTRDSVIAALLADDPEMMAAQLQFCALHQGQANDPATGEERGKIHHEWPGYPIRDQITTYNACDASAFFLIGHAYLRKKTGNQRWAIEQAAAIERAAFYIRTHLNEQNLFVESPHFCGTARFALKVTYWKDSVIIDRPNGEPAYPAVFSLAHIQNLCGMRAAAKLLDSAELAILADNMRAALRHLWDADTGNFYTAIDQQGPISAITSDGLHALYYLEVGDISAEQLQAIESSSERLESSVGFMSMTPEDAQRMARSYHASTIWPFEQALIHAGAGKFGLARVQRVCERIQRALKTNNPELVAINAYEPEISSNPQLWTIASRRYFDACKPTTPPQIDVARRRFETSTF